jgi:hypothetical protein
VTSQLLAILNGVAAALVFLGTGLVAKGYGEVGGIVTVVGGAIQAGLFAYHQQAAIAARREPPAPPEMQAMTPPRIPPSPPGTNPNA